MVGVLFWVGYYYSVVLSILTGYPILVTLFQNKVLVSKIHIFNARQSTTSSLQKPLYCYLFYVGHDILDFIFTTLQTLLQRKIMWVIFTKFRQEFVRWRCQKTIKSEHFLSSSFFLFFLACFSDNTNGTLFPSMGYLRMTELSRTHMIITRTVPNLFSFAYIPVYFLITQLYKHKYIKYRLP